MINTRLGLSDQPWMVLQELSLMDFENSDRPSVAAWYNGRECGFSILFHRGPDRTNLTVIVCVEDRNSDEIAVDHWPYDGPRLNPPTYREMPGDSSMGWRIAVRRKHFEPGAYREAADYISELMEVRP